MGSCDVSRLRREATLQWTSVYSKIVRNLHVFIYILDHRKVPSVHVLRLYRPALDKCICDHAYVHMYVHVCVYNSMLYLHICVWHIYVCMFLFGCVHTHMYVQVILEARSQCQVSKWVTVYLLHDTGSLTNLAWPTDQQDQRILPCGSWVLE